MRWPQMLEYNFPPLYRCLGYKTVFLQAQAHHFISISLAFIMHVKVKDQKQIKGEGGS